MSKQKAQPVTSIQELRQKLAEKFAALENKEISVSEAKQYATFATGMLHAIKIELEGARFLGMTKRIDFLHLNYDNKDKPQPENEISY
jgi:hypothetical protein